MVQSEAAYAINIWGILAIFRPARRYGGGCPGAYYSPPRKTLPVSRDVLSIAMNAKLFQKYMIPMKTQNVVDSCLVDEIFYKINEIYMHHATFIAFLARAMHDPSTTIGDVINKNVRSPLGLELTTGTHMTH